jgi:hypothetical protein
MKGVSPLKSLKAVRMYAFNSSEFCAKYLIQSVSVTDNHAVWS